MCTHVQSTSKEPPVQLSVVSQVNKGQCTDRKWSGWQRHKRGSYLFKRMTRSWCSVPDVGMLEASLPVGGGATVQPVVRKTRGQVGKVARPKIMGIQVLSWTRESWHLTSDVFVRETHCKKYEKSVWLMICDDFKVAWRTFETCLSLLSVEGFLRAYIYKLYSAILLVEGYLWLKDEAQSLSLWAETFSDLAPAYLPSLTWPHMTYTFGLSALKTCKRHSAPRRTISPALSVHKHPHTAL